MSLGEGSGGQEYGRSATVDGLKTGSMISAGLGDGLDMGGKGERGVKKKKKFLHFWHQQLLKWGQPDFWKWWEEEINGST